MRQRGFVVGVMLLAAAASRADADGDGDGGGDDATGDRQVTVRGVAEIEYVDVEGPGGFSNREPGLIKPSRRSPAVDIDKVAVDVGVRLEEGVRAHAELRADRDGGRIDRLYVDALVADRPEYQVLVQAGRQKPIERPPDRRVETYSPLGSLFWRGREWHAGATVLAHLGQVDITAIASLAMQRDLGDQTMGEDPNLPTIAFVDTKPGEGAAVEVGGLLGASGRGAGVAAFGFRGRLLDNAGPDRLQRTFLDDYRTLAGEPPPSGPDPIDDRTSIWYGARATYQAHGVFALAEGIGQRMGLLRRRGFEVGASYTVKTCMFGRRLEVEPFLRYGQITTTNLPARPLIPESWDRQQIVPALLVRPSTRVEVKVEYLFLLENSAQARGDELQLDDDELLVQVRLTEALP